MSLASVALGFVLGFVGIIVVAGIWIFGFICGTRA
jgi:hypothetical protein